MAELKYDQKLIDCATAPKASAGIITRSKMATS